MENIRFQYESSSSEDECPLTEKKRSHETLSQASNENNNVILKMEKRPKQPPKTDWIRNFPHVKGNWASHVFIKVKPSSDFELMIKNSIQFVKEKVNNETEIVEDIEETHLSLSRTFILKFEQIDDFIQELKHRLVYRKRFSLELKTCKIFCNDEKTRSFVSILVGEGKEKVCGIIECVDRALRAFQQRGYYENPEPHVTIASSISDDLYTDLKNVDMKDANTKSLRIQVDEIECKIGCKMFCIPLQDNVNFQ